MLCAPPMSMFWQRRKKFGFKDNGKRREEARNSVGLNQHGMNQKTAHLSIWLSELCQLLTEGNSLNFIYNAKSIYAEIYGKKMNGCLPPASGRLS